MNRKILIAIAAICILVVAGAAYTLETQQQQYTVTVQTQNGEPVDSMLQVVSTDGHLCILKYVGNESGIEIGGTDGNGNEIRGENIDPGCEFYMTAPANLSLYCKSNGPTQFRMFANVTITVPASVSTMYTNATLTLQADYQCLTVYAHNGSEYVLQYHQRPNGGDAWITVNGNDLQYLFFDGEKFFTFAPAVIRVRDNSGYVVNATLR
jgi:hypothetical protein